MEIFKKPRGVRLESSSVDGPLHPDIVEDGRQLFEDFMSNQIDTSFPQFRPLVEERTPTPPSRGANLSQTATRLRHLATTFSQSDERQQVREMAMEIDSDISGDELGYLLFTMLSNSEHIEEGIVVIFFFCFDLVARLIKNGLKSYMDILEICVTAIIKAVGPKVQEHGGWTHTIQSTTSNSVAMGVLTTGMLFVGRLGLKTLFNV